MTMKTHFLLSRPEASAPSTPETCATPRGFPRLVAPAPSRPANRLSLRRLSGDKMLLEPADKMSASLAGARAFGRAAARRSSAILTACLLAALALPGCSRQPNAESDPAGRKRTEETTTSAAAGLARCSGHNAPRELCFICDPTLREPGRLWCSEHARYEDRCWECHPEAQDKNRPFCDQHGLYKDECFLCQPKLKRASVVVAQASGPQVSGVSVSQAAGGKMPPRPANRMSVPDGLMCREHGVPEVECGICRPERAGKLQPGESLKVRLPGQDSAALAGVQTDTPRVSDVADGIECFAELAFNQNRLAQIVAPVGGIVQEVTVDLGSRIEERQVVARIWSAAIAEAVARAVLTHQTLERERKLRAERVTPQKDLEQAEAEHRAACQHARTLGFSEADIDAFGTRPDEPVYLEVRAPFAGEIVERTAVRGALVEAGRPLFTLADRSTLWAMLSIPEAVLGRVRVGQPVELELDSVPGRKFAGTLTWIAAEVDERTRMARARAEVPNPDGMLRARMFARARILTRRGAGALVLPGTAIQRVEGRPMVFVKLAGDLFEARAVRLGVKHGGLVEILEGLSAQDEVVVTGSFPLKSQLLVSRLGAGCAEE